MICGGVLPEGGKPMVISEGRRGHDDRKLVKSIIAELNKYDLLIGFNSLNFDVRYLNSRALHWDIDPLAGKLHCDLYRIAKPVFKTTKYTSCSLKTITDQLRYPTDMISMRMCNKKCIDLRGVVWKDLAVLCCRKAVTLHKAAINQNARCRKFK